MKHKKQMVIHGEWDHNGIENHDIIGSIGIAEYDCQQLQFIAIDFWNKVDDDDDLHHCQSIYVLFAIPAMRWWNHCVKKKKKYHDET